MQKETITHIDLFSGIGGFALAADRVFTGGVQHVFCEIDPFCQEVLKKHWPKSKIYGDIRTLTKSESGESREQTEQKGRQDISGSGCDILTGGFPCQPFSQAGQRKGTDDNRFLWPEMLRVIREFAPLWVIAENVRGLLTIQQGVVFQQVCTDLEDAGYEVQPLIIPAVALNAPHRRDRVWFIAHRKSVGERGSASEECGDGKRVVESKKCEGDSVRSESEGCVGECDATNSTLTRGQCRKPRKPRKHTQPQEGLSGWDNSGTNRHTIGLNVQGERKQQDSQEPDRLRDRKDTDWNQNWLEVASRLCRVDDGIPKRMDRNPRLKALGNAIVPQVAEEIMRAIKNQ